MTRILFPKDLSHVSNLNELLASNRPAIYPCIKPERVRLPLFSEFGSPHFWNNPDFIDQRASYVHANGWALLSVKDVFCWHNLFLLTRTGELILPFPKWRVSSLIDYYGSDQETIERRLFAHPAIRDALCLLQGDCDAVVNSGVAGQASAIFGGVHGHWLFEELLPLSIWSHLEFFPKMVVADLKVYQKDIIRAAQLPTEFVQAEGPLQKYENFILAIPYQICCEYSLFKERYGPDNQMFCYNQELMNWQSAGTRALNFTRRIGLSVSNDFEVHSKIYVMRDRGSSHSVCLNESELCKLAEQYGFIVIDPSTLSGEQEVAIFYNASVVMGTLGGGLENIVFCKPGTQVIAICGEDSWRPSITRVVAFGNLVFTRIRCVQFTAMDGWFYGSFSNYVADLHLIKQTLDRLTVMNDGNSTSG